VDRKLGDRVQVTVEGRVKSVQVGTAAGRSLEVKSSTGTVLRAAGRIGEYTGHPALASTLYGFPPDRLGRHDNPVTGPPQRAWSSYRSETHHSTAVSTVRSRIGADMAAGRWTTDLKLIRRTSRSTPTKGVPLITWASALLSCVLVLATFSLGSIWLTEAPQLRHAGSGPERAHHAGQPVHRIPGPAGGISGDSTRLPLHSITAAPLPDAGTTGPVEIAPRISALAVDGIPTVAVAAYRAAADAADSDDPGCHLSWALLAGIGRVESDHGRFAGAQLRTDGTSTIPIIGIALDGVNTALIGDTDRGRLDGDVVYDRAVGPMQFIPSTWRAFSADGDADGIADPFDINDAALAAAHYLCRAGGDLATQAGQVRAVLAYNHSSSYVADVLALAAAYASGDTGQVTPVTLPPLLPAPPTFRPVDPGRPPALPSPSPHPSTAAHSPMTTRATGWPDPTTNAPTSPASITHVPSAAASSTRGSSTAATVGESTTRPADTSPAPSSDCPSMPVDTASAPPGTTDAPTPVRTGSLGGASDTTTAPVCPVVAGDSPDEPSPPLAGSSLATVFLIGVALVSVLWRRARGRHAPLS
jgi:hypothetical protein